MIAGLFFSGFGFLLDPQTIGSYWEWKVYEMYKVKRADRLDQPFESCGLCRHNFGYDRLPTVVQSLRSLTGC